MVGNAKFNNVAKVSYKIAIKKNIIVKTLAEEFLRNINAQNTHYNDEIKKFTLSNNLNFIDEYDFYCESNLCKLFDEKRNLFMWDADHLIEYGSKYYEKNYLSLYKNKYLLYFLLSEKNVINL